MTDSTSVVSEIAAPAPDGAAADTQLAAGARTIVVSEPQAGYTVIHQLGAGEGLKLDFDPAKVTNAEVKDGSLEIAFENGGVVVIGGFAAWSAAGGAATGPAGGAVDLAQLLSPAEPAAPQVCEIPGREVKVVDIPLPAAGERLSIAVPPGEGLRLACEFKDVRGAEVGDTLELTFPSGGVVVIENFAQWAAAEGATLTDCVCGGMNLADFIVALGLNPEDVLPAAGPAGGALGGTDLEGSGFTPGPGPQILSGLPYPHILPPTALQYGVPEPEETFFPVEDGPPRTVGSPTVSLDLGGEDDCIEEDSTILLEGQGGLNPDNVVAVAAAAGEADDELTQIVLAGFQSDWTYDFTGLQTSEVNLGASDFDATDGTIAIVFNSGVTGYSGTFSVQPPPDSDVDHPTLTATVTAADQVDPSVSADAVTTLNIDVDAVADGPGGGANGGLGVDISVDDSGPDAEFSPNEAGTVTVNATFGDTDGSETHTILIDIPAGFTVGTLPAAPGVVSAVVNPSGDVLITMNGTTASLSNYQFQVTAPGAIADGTTFTFTATVTADEEASVAANPNNPNGSGEECADDNNTAQDVAQDSIAGGGAVGPDVDLFIHGGDCLIEDTECTLGFLATPQSVGDQISQVVISGFPTGAGAWSVDVGSLALSDDDGTLVLNADYTVSFNAATGTLTVTFAVLPNGQVDGTIEVTPNNDSDVDGSLDISATAVDGAASATTTKTDVAIPVDAVADGTGGGPNGGLNVDISVDDSGPDAEFAPNESGTVTVNATFGDIDGSETHTILIDIPAGFTVGTLPTPAGVISAIVDGNGDVLITMNGTTASLSNYQFQVTAPGAIADGTTFTFTATATADEEASVAANPNNPNGSGEECTDANNVAQDTAKDSIAGGGAAEPEVTLGVAGGDCLTEDTEGTLAFSAIPQSNGDSISQIVISGFPTGAGAWNVNVGSLALSDDDGTLVLNTDYTVSFNAATGTLTVTFAVLPDGQVDGTIDVTPNNDSDVDGSLDISATAVDGASSATTTQNDVAIHVDAVADGPGGGANGGLDVAIDVNDSGNGDAQFSSGETGTVTVNATFGDIDGSETHTILIDIPSGFTVGTLSTPAGVTSAVVDGNGDVLITMNGTTASLSNYQFQVTAPGGVTDGQTFAFTATATADEEASVAANPNNPNGSGEECDDANNVATDQDGEQETGNAVGTPDVNLVVGGDGCVEEDTATPIQITANAATAGDLLTQVVITAPAGWVLSAAVGGDITNVSGGGTNTLTLTLTGTQSSFSDSVTATPPNDTDVDAVFNVQATAADGPLQATGSENFTVHVDAVADGTGGGPNGGLDVTIDVSDSGNGDAQFSSGETGTVTVNATFGDIDGSETHTILVDIPSGFTVGTLPAAPGVLSAVVNASGDVLITMNGTTASLSNYQFQVTAPGGVSDGQAFAFTATATADEEASVAANPNNPNGSGEECDDANNVATDQDSEQQTGNAVAMPDVNLVVGGDGCLTEDTEGTLSFSATPQGTGDQISQIVLGGVPTGAGAWTVDVASLTLSDGDGALVLNTDYTVSFNGATGALTINFLVLPTGTVNGTVEVTPNADSDVDDSLTLSATAVDGPLQATGTENFDVHVDAVADAPTNVTISATSASGDVTFLQGESGTLAVAATFGDAADGSETHSIVVAVPDGFTVTNAAGGVAVVNPDGSTTITFSSVAGTSFSANLGIQLTGVADQDAEFSVTATATEEASVANNPNNPNGSGEECTDANNTQQVTVTAPAVSKQILDVAFITNTNVNVQPIAVSFIDIVSPQFAYAAIYGLDDQGQGQSFANNVGFDIETNRQYAVVIEQLTEDQIRFDQADIENVNVVPAAGQENLELDNSPNDAQAAALTAVITPSNTLDQAHTESTDGTQANQSLTPPAATAGTGNAVPSQNTVHYVYGADGNDTLTGGNDTDVLNGGVGDLADDGAQTSFDSLLGGAGNDILVFDPLDALIDGGSGADVLRIDQGALFLFNNPGSSTATVNISGEPIQNIEVLLITDEAVVNVDGSSRNVLTSGTTLTLSAADVLNFADDTLDADGIAANTLFIAGNVGDTVSLTGTGWSGGVVDAQGFAVWTNVNGATVKVEDEVAVVTS
jgi:hypothetical protein